MKDVFNWGAMQFQPIQTEAEYDAAIAHVTELMGSEPGTAESVELDDLATLVVAYEDEHFPMNEPDPETPRRIALENGWTLE
jgi:HTH-type transcriptional regulator/antitoxin HigA